MSMTCLTK